MSKSCIDFPVPSSVPLSAMRFGFPGEDDIGGEIRFFDSAFTVDISTPLFRAGDLIAAGNGTKLIIDDANQLTTLSDTQGQGLFIDFLNTRYQFGDINNTAGNGTHLDIDDAGEATEIRDAAGQMLALNRGLGLYQFGDIDAVLNNNFIRIDDTNEEISIFLNGSRGLRFNVSGTAREYRIGDEGGAGNGTEINIDDQNQVFQVNAANGININGDTVLLHTGVALANGAGAATGTLTNTPTAGNPTKWVSIIDAGVTRYIPTWL